MSPRYRLLAVRLDGEFFPAILDECTPNARPMVWEKSRLGHAELCRLMVEHNVPGSLGFSQAHIAAMPHYLSDEKVAEIRAMAKRAD